MAAVYDPDCERARERLVQLQEIPQSKHLPRGPTSYFPRKGIVQVLRDFPVRTIVMCACPRCEFHADLRGRLDDRNWTIEDSELLDRYATIYGLLIYLRYPGLITTFLREQSYLAENHYLSEKELETLDKCRALTKTQAQIIRREILENQHRFNVRSLRTRKFITTIDEEEILPIKEDNNPVGKGDLGEVYAFTFSDGYVDDELLPVSFTPRRRLSRTVMTRLCAKKKRFARKIFDRRWTQVDTAKEWVNHLYANKLQHPNPTEALAAFDHGNYFFIVSELAQCTLRDFLLDKGSVTLTPQDLWSQMDWRTCMASLSQENSC